jgi:hypothetical protein
MTDEPENLVLRYLRRVAEVDRIKRRLDITKG